MRGRTVVEVEARDDRWVLWVPDAKTGELKPKEFLGFKGAQWYAHRMGFDVVVVCRD